MKGDAFHQHDHRQCVHDALAQAETLCGQRGARLTPLRERVLELVWTSHQPLGAYELLDKLTTDGRKPAPPTVYRALEFLLAQGLIHRIASRNAYVGCNEPATSHVGYFLICTACGNAEEIASPALAGSIQAMARASGFAIREQTVELGGLCQHCQQAPAEHHHD
jgi:Fur family zinc uptake transcriptional regulator